ncbi:secreted RxLR effector protein 161-like [Henckelia pumila]|uniref:secreted RxLR effector protein 161-like n=1 Tax=Henckelia pumila TaxID=405737 RepID=UPI003C6E9F6B
MCPKTQDEREKMRTCPYDSTVESLMYAMLCTRSDSSHAISIASRYQSNPGPEHWTAVKHILKYLNRTKHYCLVFGGEDLTIYGYTDSDFQSDIDDRKSTSGFVLNLGKGAVSWRSRKQDTTADSTTEAEYVAASEAAKEAIWIRKFVQELGIVPSIESPITVYCDNNGAIAQAKKSRAHQKSKHIERRFHLIRDIIHRGDIAIAKIATTDNVADPFTKSLFQKVFEKHIDSMG